MKAIKKDQWKPTDNLILEENALEISKSESNSLVVAGPGAGKTELLAQKACFLLQTNTCNFPHKILAISFKKDAAYNLKERVRLRSGNELSMRFDSFTFDSFAKHIVDRFKQTLPEEFKLSDDYDVILDERTILDFYTTEEINTFSSKDKLIKYHTFSRLSSTTGSDHEKTRLKAWLSMLNGRKSKLTFKMIMRLAELIVNSNPKIKKFIQETYHYVFLDEFQDTTDIQYDFFKSCFLDSSCAFTAVGDDKQRIMIWAGAKVDIFSEYMKDTNAPKISLEMNFRSAPRLVALQNHLVKHLLNKTEVSIPSSKWKPDQGECSFWVFETPDSEMEILFKSAKKWIDDGLNPREICILVKQKLDKYAGKIIDYFNENGIKARDENFLQSLLAEEISAYIINVLYTIFKTKSSTEKRDSFMFLANLHTEFEDKQLLKLEVGFSVFIKNLTKEYKNITLTEDQVNELIEKIIAFAGKERIRAAFPSYKNNLMLNEIISDLKSAFLRYYLDNKIVIDALDSLIGKDTIPVMTIHKSKGLEYNTVVFVGLEDGAFWSFEKQPDEDKCSFFVALSRAKERVVFTFSKQREIFTGLQAQSISKIKIILDELDKSGVVEMKEKK